MMPSRSISDLDIILQPLAQQFIKQCALEGLSTFVTQTYRSAEDQNRDYAQGRTLPGAIVTYARGMESPHNCVDQHGQPAAKAFDFAIKNENGSLNWDASSDPWKRAIAIGESLGLVSGSIFHHLQDNPHLELPNWKNVQ